MATPTKALDTATLFVTDEEQLELINDAMASGDVDYIAHAIGIVARARGLSAMERETGKKRQTLNKALKAGGNPTLETILPVLSALHLRLAVEREPEPA